MSDRDFFNFEASYRLVVLVIVVLIMSQTCYCDFTFEETEDLVNYLKKSLGVLHGEFSNVKEVNEKWENEETFYVRTGEKLNWRASL